MAVSISRRFLNIFLLYGMGLGLAMLMGACSSLLIPGRRCESEQLAEEMEDELLEEVAPGASDVGGE